VFELGVAEVEADGLAARAGRCSRELTLTTRAVSGRSSAGSSSLVSRNGASALTARVSSKPSAVTRRDGLVCSTPAMLNRTSMRPMSSASAAANVLIEASEARSAAHDSTLAAGLFVRI
jgi:hypothetical protein